MVERTLRSIARALAEEFYENVRSSGDRGKKFEIRSVETGDVIKIIDPELFAKTYPTMRDYLVGRRHGHMEKKRESSGVLVNYHVDDGSVRSDTPGWMHHYERARQRAYKMLSMPNVHQNIKDGLLAAIIEDREQQYKQQAAGIKPVPIPQRRDA